MAWLRFEAIWTGSDPGSGWLEPAWIEVKQGVITNICDHRPDSRPAYEVVPGYALPGIPNGHSHAFQYAMAGSAEHLAPDTEADDFWSWRETMYRLALSLDPDSLRAIAAGLYMQMLKRGYTAVAEFHYIHHDPQGQPYAEPAELSIALAQAAEETGIQLTLVPVYYRLGGFGREASASQRRFLFRSVDHYLSHLQRVREAVSDPVVMSYGIHSLRAAGRSDIREILSSEFNAPFHIHVAEQTKEVEQCLAHWGARPVEWLLQHTELDANFNLIHATHMTPEECEAVARRGANVVICPTTEANLGDGIFPLGPYLDSGGRWCVGSDSHVGTDPFEELRWLDYMQRLTLRRRNIVCRQGGDDSGEVLLRSAIQYGAAAIGRPTSLAVGESLDCLVIDMNHPKLAVPAQRRLSRLVFGYEPDMLLGTMTRGVWRVERGLHSQEKTVRSRFTEVMRRLWA